MARAFLAKELYLEVKNEAGLLGRIVSSLAIEGVYIVHLSAYSVEELGILQMITRDNDKARKAIGHFVPHIEERDVLIVEFENKVGTLAPVAKILGNHDIFIRSVYGTSSDGFKIVGVLSTQDNARAAQLINDDSQALGI
jgi:hypothetical protein